MGEYDTWAPVYDAWAAGMTEDVAHYVALAREAEGPIVELAASLRPGGRFGFDAFAFGHTIAAQLDGTTQDNNGVVPSLRYVPADNRIDITRDAAATIHLWWATKEEWDGLIDVAGLEVEALPGWLDRRPFDDESLEFVDVVRKP
jgi:hypothetical protein